MAVTIGVFALIAIVVGFIGIALFDALRPGLGTGTTSHEELRDPSTCDHEWATWDSGTCMTGYSSYGGPDPQEEWRIERCRLCGAEAFHCSGSCDCCAFLHEGSSQ